MVSIIVLGNSEAADHIEIIAFGDSEVAKSM